MTPVKQLSRVRIHAPLVVEETQTQTQTQTQTLASISCCEMETEAEAPTTVLSGFRSASKALAVGYAHVERGETVVGRETETGAVREFWMRALGSRKGGAMYISGAPGTGKSLTLSGVADDVHDAKALDGYGVMPAVVTVHLNCMSHMTPRNAYSTLLGLIAKQLGAMGLSLDELVPGAADLCLGSGKARQEDVARATLGALFALKAIPCLGRSDSRAQQRAGSRGSEVVCEASYNKGDQAIAYIVVLDEMDQLGSRKGNEILYQLFDWAGFGGSLVLFGIANALDLTARMLPQLRALGNPPVNLEFRPYTAVQLTSILQARLDGAGLPALFQRKALSLLCKRVQNETGDVRMALNLARNIIDSIIAKGGKGLEQDLDSFAGLSIPVVAGHLRTTLGSQQGSTLASLSLHQKLLLISCAIRVSRTGKHYLTWAQAENAYRHYCTEVAHFTDFAKGAEFYALAESLQTLSLVIISKSPNSSLSSAFSAIASSSSASTGTCHRAMFIRVVATPKVISKSFSTLSSSLFDRLIHELNN